MVTMKTFDSRAEWLAGRSGSIGGSEASSIVGANPWQTNLELWEIKTGKRIPEDISEKPLVKYGSQAERHLRELFRLDFPQYRVEYVDNNMWFNDRFPFAHASLDGWLEDERGRRGILEIKTAGITQFWEWHNRIPEGYYWQILHYLMVTEFDFAIIKAQLKYDWGGEIFLITKHYKIEREEVREDIKFLEDSEKMFFWYIKNGERPPQ